MLEHSVVWCGNLDTSESRSEIHGKFLNVALEKNGDHLDRCVRNKEVLHRVKEERNVLRSIKRRKANWIGHILRRILLLKHVIEGNVEG